jgi:kumamolisin
MAEERMELEGSRRPAPSGATRVGSADPDDAVELTITLRAPELPPADPANAPIGADEFAEKFGSNPADADAVKQELEKYGLHVYDVSPATSSVRVSGTVEQVEKAFDVDLATYENGDQGEFRGRSGVIRLPADLAGIVTGVFGLDDRRMARRKAAAHDSAAPLTPPDLESRYDFPAGDAAGQSIAIAEFGGSYVNSDVQAFCQKYNRAVPTVTPVPVGYPILTIAQIEQLPKQQQENILEDSVEVMMDVEIVAALCPASAISVYFAPFSQRGWIDLLNAVHSAAPKPVALSISWGLAEDAPDWSASAIKEINRRLHAAALMGITVCAASGDDGAGDQLNDGRAHVNFPASSPYVLSVGGTMLTSSPAAEVVWWQAPGDRAGGGGSTGGGVSTVFPRPTWQKVTVASLNAGAIDGRVVPDVAALAGAPLYDLIFLGRDSPNGGTSAATPLWAALLARIAAGLPTAHQHRFLTPLLYRDGATGQPLGSVACIDITSGNNASPGLAHGYVASNGFDAVSGWGIPDGNSLQEALS